MEFRLTVFFSIYGIDIFSNKDTVLTSATDIKIRFYYYYWTEHPQTQTTQTSTLHSSILVDFLCLTVDRWTVKSFKE